MEWKVKPPMEFHFLYHFKKPPKDQLVRTVREFSGKNDANLIPTTRI